MVDTVQDHHKVRQFERQRIDVADIKRRIQYWQLTDCTEATLEQMRHNIISEMELLQQRLQEENHRFDLYLENGRPLQADETRRTIDRVIGEWDTLNEQVQAIDEAILERHLRGRMIHLLGSEQRLNFLDRTILFAIAFVVILTFIELFIHLPQNIITIIITLDTITCFFLLGDFLTRFYLAEDRRWYFRRYWVDLVASIPFYEVLRFGQLARLTRFARLFRLLRLSRAARVVLFTFRGLNKLTRTFQINLLKRSVIIALILLVFGAFSIVAFEANQQENAPSGLSQGLWWSFVTVVTGGFPDIYNPSTAGGRAVTVGLVLLGLTVTGIFTASLTSVLVEDESTRLEQGQATLDNQIGILGQKLDLLSFETNQGLIALETASQKLSNQRTRTGIAQVLCQTIMDDFAGIQTSVHLLNEGKTQLTQIAQLGNPSIGPLERVAVGDGFIGTVVADLLAQKKRIAELDIEPITSPYIEVDGIRMVCPLVASHRLIGVLHAVLPENLGRYYLYNRAPMTLAHHAAVALYAAQLGAKLSDSPRSS